MATSCRRNEALCFCYHAVSHLLHLLRIEFKLSSFISLHLARAYFFFVWLLIFNLSSFIFIAEQRITCLHSAHFGIHQRDIFRATASYLFFLIFFCSVPLLLILLNSEHPKSFKIYKMNLQKQLTQLLRDV